MWDLGPLKKVMNFLMWLLVQIAIKNGVDVKSYPGGPPKDLE